MCPVHSLVCLPVALDTCKMQQTLIHQASQPPLGESDGFFFQLALCKAKEESLKDTSSIGGRGRGTVQVTLPPVPPWENSKVLISEMEGKKCCHLFSCCIFLPKAEEAVSRCTFVSVSSRQSLLLMPERSCEHLHPFVLWAAFGEPLVCPSKLLCASALSWRQAQ